MGLSFLNISRIFANFSTIIYIQKLGVDKMQTRTRGLADPDCRLADRTGGLADPDWRTRGPGLADSRTRTDGLADPDWRTRS